MRNKANLKQEMQSCGIAFPMLHPPQIAALRERMGLSQAEMAAVVGVSSRLTVSQWERGSSIPGGPVMRFLSLLDSLSAAELRTMIRRLEKINQDESAAQVVAKSR
jgi:DNA-binding transcriptional regulator YiaG